MLALCKKSTCVSAYVCVCVCRFRFRCRLIFRFRYSSEIQMQMTSDRRPWTSDLGPRTGDLGPVSTLRSRVFCGSKLIDRIGPKNSGQTMARDVSGPQTLSCAAFLNYITETPRVRAIACIREAILADMLLLPVHASSSNPAEADGFGACAPRIPGVWADAVACSALDALRTKIAWVTSARPPTAPTAGA